MKYALKDNSGEELVETSIIIRFEGASSYTNVFMVGRDASKQCGNLGIHWERVKNTEGFLRVSDSHIVNAAHVIRFNKDGTVTMSDKERVPLDNDKIDLLKSMIPRC